MSEKQAGQVLTSENAAEFYAQKLGLAQSEPEAVAVVEEAAEPAQEEDTGSEPEAKEEAKQEEPKKANPKLERRFSDLTKQREEARKEAQREREQREALEKRLAALETKSQPAKAETVDEEPQPSQFQDAFERSEEHTSELQSH